MEKIRFLKGLLIRNLAVSSRVRIRKDGFLNYVRDTLRFYRNDEVIDFMDCEKNMEAFLQSPYCEEFYYDKLFRPKYGFPPFLLLQRTQERVEKAMIRYLSLPSGLEACDEEKGNKMKKNKLEAYVEWLYSIALYEILLRNCFDDISRNLLSNPKADRMMNFEEEKELVKIFPNRFPIDREDFLRMRQDKLCVIWNNILNACGIIRWIDVRQKQRKSCGK